MRRVRGPAEAAAAGARRWPGETDPSGRFTLRTVRCLGLCALSPAMKMAGQSFGRVALDRVPAILEQFS